MDEGPALQLNSCPNVASHMYGLSSLHVHHSWCENSPQGVKSKIREGELSPILPCLPFQGFAILLSWVVLVWFCIHGAQRVFHMRVVVMFGAGRDEKLWNGLPVGKGPRAERSFSVVTPAGIPVSSQPSIPEAQSSALFAKNNHYKGARGGLLLFCFVGLGIIIEKEMFAITKQLLWTSMFMETVFCYTKPLLLIIWIEMRF